MTRVRATADLLPDLDAYLANFRARVLQDAVNEATASYWLRYADRLLAARPTVQDYRGQATTEELRARWHRLTEQAQACRHRAEVSLLQDGIDPDVRQALEEVA